MKKTNYLKIGFVLVCLAAAAVCFGLRSENAAAQTKVKSKSVKTRSLCTKSEQTIWSCATTRNKVASVCASKDLAEDRGYVQYRYGTSARIELEFPKDRKDSARKFKYKRYTRPLVTMLTLSFENGGFSYVLEDDDMEEEKPVVREATIDISKGAEKTASVVCRLPISGSLMKLEDIVPHDEEN